MMEQQQQSSSSCCSSVKIVGSVRLSDKQRRKNNKGQELYRFVPLSTTALQLHYKGCYDGHKTQILIASDAINKRKAASKNTYLHDLYVIMVVVSREDHLWYGRIEEIIGDCTDINHCASALAHNRGLMHQNKAFLRRLVTGKMIGSTSGGGAQHCSDVQVPTSRIDLRDGRQYSVFSVDPPNCLDIDDAIHIRPLPDGCYEIGIHIADVTNFIKFHEEESGRIDEIVREALHRSFTVYLPDRQVPILPPYLSHELCSLQRDQDRFVISCLLVISPVAEHSLHPSSDLLTKGYQVDSCRFQKSVIRSCGAFTYDEIDEFLLDTAMSNSDAVGGSGKKSLPRQVKSSLKLLRKVFADLNSHEFIEILMIRANSQVAQLLQSSRSPYLLRRQLPFAPSDRPDSEFAFEGVPFDLRSSPAEYIYCDDDSGAASTGDTAVDGDHLPTVYTPLEKQHSSLHLAVYTHFTSPIRRFADQVVHSLLTRCIDAPEEQASSCPWTSTFDRDSVGHLNRIERLHKKYSRDMAILNFVFHQCGLVNSAEVSLGVRGVVLPFRFSEKHRCYKTDLYLLAPCDFVYPLRLHTSAQRHLFDIDYDVRESTLRIVTKHTAPADMSTGAAMNNTVCLVVGQSIPLEIHCMKSAASLKKKCVISSPAITIISRL